MTQSPQDTPRKTGRPRKWDERTLGTFQAGTFDRIAAVLEPGEDRTSFLRTAVERELQRREQDAPNR